MYDFWIGDVNIAPFLLLITSLVIFPGQLLLCYKGKTRIARLLPVIVLSVLTAAAIIAVCICTGWNIVLYIVSAIYLAIMLAACGIAWGIWAIIKCIKKS